MNSVSSHAGQGHWVNEEYDEDNLVLASIMHCRRETHFNVKQIVDGCDTDLHQSL